MSQWLKWGRAGGPQPGARSLHPGAPRLTAEQRTELPRLLAHGAESFGCLGEVWTSKRVAAVIAPESGVHYHPDPTIPTLYGSYCARPAGGPKSLSAERRNATKQRVSAGSPSGGQRVKHSPGGAAYHRLGRRAGLLSTARGGAHWGGLAGRRPSYTSCSRVITSQ